MKRENSSLFLFQLLVLFLPTQLAIHFWPDWAFVLGLRSDYLAPTLYFTDLLVVGLLILNVKEILGTIKFNRWIILACLFIVLNIIFSANNPVSLYWWAKLVEMFLLYICLRLNWPRYRKALNTPLSLAIIFITIVSILQIVNQGSLGGLLYWLGERRFNFSTPGISLAMIGGQSFLRPYAFSPHPNVLGGIALLSFLFLSSTGKSFISKTAVVASLFLLVLSNSQSAWLAGLVVLFLSFVKDLKVKKIILGGLLFLSLLLSLVLPLVGKYVYQENISNLPSFIQSRLSLSFIAGNLLKENPLFGLGIGSFIPKSIEVVSIHPDLFENVRFAYLQPVHNLFLLAFVEGGFIGLFLLSALFWKSLLRGGKYILPVLAVLIIGLFDHYFLTLHQGLLLLVFALLFLTESN